MSDQAPDLPQEEAAKTLPERLAEFVIVPLMLGIIAVGFSGVVMRFVFSGRYALFWTEEVVRYSFIWLFWLCAPVLVWRGSMFAVDLVLVALPAHLQKALRLLHGAAIIFLLGVYAYHGWSMAQINGRQLSSALQIPLFWIYLSIPVGSLLIIAVVLVQMGGIVTGRGYGAQRS